jgi:hypothetical protein
MVENIHRLGRIFYCGVLFEHPDPLSRFKPVLAMGRNLRLRLGTMRLGWTLTLNTPHYLLRRCHKV